MIFPELTFLKSVNLHSSLHLTEHNLMMQGFSLISSSAPAQLQLSSSSDKYDMWTIDDSEH